MPLWLYTVGALFYKQTTFENEESHLQLPWTNIVFSLVGLIVPILFGMIFGWFLSVFFITGINTLQPWLGHYKQHLVERIRKIIKWFTIALIIFILIFSSYANWLDQILTFFS